MPTGPPSRAGPDAEREPPGDPLGQGTVERAARRRDALGALEADEAAFVTPHALKPARGGVLSRRPAH